FDGAPATDTPPPPMPDTMPAMAPPPLQVPPAPDALVDPAPETMEAARPGADGSKPKRVGKGGGPSLTLSRPIKLAALMVGVAAIGLIATKTIMPMVFGKPAPSGQSAGQVPQQQLATVEGLDDTNPSGTLETLDTPQSQTPPIQTVDAVGDYSETMKAPELGPETGAGQLTLVAAATGGNPVAQFQLGLVRLESGDDAEAVRLIRLAANQNQPAAQYRLAKLYEAGIGVKQSPETAMSLLTMAAKNGNRIAMHDLGHYYTQGVGDTAPDIATAAGWFAKAAERGVLDSQFNLGVLYQEGTGVERSLPEAYFWFSIAGAQGDKVAAARASVIAKDLTASEKEAVDARVKAFTPKPINEAANGIFRKLPWIMPSPQARNSADDIIRAQKLLTSLGYNVGKPDGAMGPKTRNAIIRFERANGMPETGRVNATLMQRLNLAAGA
ncbi:MAG TPA: hypothetical protein ENJ42_05750, partial [Hellea balneolensis]|nr:hypothetical protein [Hellea balneolensis]